jgi:hypothetical protein
LKSQIQIKKDFPQKKTNFMALKKEEIFFIVQTFWDVTSFIATTAAAVVRYKLKREPCGQKRFKTGQKEKISKRRNPFLGARPV